MTDTCWRSQMGDSEAFDFEALDEETELSAGITAQDDGQLSELARFVTVLSDFGETEQFVIEGDSLIFLAFEDERLDWKHGGQFLHFFFIVEKFLSQLLRRGAHFSVVFFESTKQIWTGSRLLARNLLISHLKGVLKSPAAIYCFPAANSEEWAAFLLRYRPLFIGVSMREKESILTQFAKSCHSSGISILYLSQMEILDHSVRGFYVPARCIFNGEASTNMSPIKSTVETKPQNISKLSDEFFHVTSKSWRSMACCNASAAWLAFIQQEDSLEKVAAETILKIFLVQTVLMRRNVFSIYERGLVKFFLPQPILAMVQRFTEFISEFISVNLLESSKQDDDSKSTLQEAEFIDFYDGRLLCALADRILQLEVASAEDLSIDAECRHEMEVMWSACTGASDVACVSTLFPLKFSSHSCSALRDFKDDSSDNLIKAQISACDLTLPNCPFATSILGLVQCHEGVKTCAEPPTLDKNLLDGMGWKSTEALESFLWTHCKDQSASSDNSRSTSEWERKRQIRWKARQSQMYFRHLHDYAASLAGTTVLGSTCISAGDIHDEQQADDDAASTVSEQSVDSKKGKPKPEKKKPEKKLSKKEQLLADIEAKKLKGASQKLEVEWKDLKVAIKKSGSSVAKLKDLDDFIVRCMAASQISLALEVTLEKLEESRLAWQEDRDSKSDNMKFAILTVETVRIILVNFSELLRDPLAEIAVEARNDIIQTMVSLGFIEPALQLSRSFLDPNDLENYAKLQDETKETARLFRNKLSIPSKSLAHFQLEHMGYLLPRPPPKVKDPRITTFTPDEWQRTLLDVVDSRDSALVCAPTSSGKTFISYYCMEKVMRDSTCKDGVLVFVAPTKALINQIAAQVYGESFVSFASI
jgi:ATP-dependent RNA helicase DDX60